jgi:putative effector of murein hydrolase LrgA (UPF0299 family)
VRHLACFFIPTAVGLMAFGDLFVRHGVAIVVTLIVSTAIGIWVAGLTSQVLTRRRGGDTPYSTPKALRVASSKAPVFGKPCLA